MQLLNLIDQDILISAKLTSSVAHFAVEYNRNPLKMQTLFMIALCVAPSFATPDLNDDPRLNYSIVKMEYRKDVVDTGLLGCKFISEQVNIQDQAPWEASDSVYTSTSPELTIRSLDLPDSEVDRSKLDEFDQLDDTKARSMFNIPLPEYYDARLKYENCPSLSRVEDQGCGCRGSWAVAPASALSDRYCIYYNDGTTAQVSAENVLSCCAYCTQGQGCEGGYSLWAWVYLQYTLVVSGGSYGSREGCQNYKIPSCQGRAVSFVVPTPKCQSLCDDESEPYFWYSARKSYLHRNTTIQAIQRDIFENGPVTADMKLYEDFFCYRSGVYKHLYGEQISVQTVKLIGWGKEDGVDYWLAANSWGQEWGENGFFKIQRGNNECNIEYLVISGLVQPMLPKQYGSTP